MRFLNKALKFLLIIVFIFSVALNIIFAFSSTTISIFTNKEKAMKEIYYASATALSNSEQITITATMPYSLLEGHTSTDKIACKKANEGEKLPYNCEMISKLYNKDSALVKTSYFPGDGYKYTEEGTEQTKTVFSNESLYSYFYSLIYGASYNINYLLADSETMKSYSMDFKTNFNFNINTFSLDKSISVSYKESETVTQTINLEFDSKDRLQYVSDQNNKSNLVIDYSNQELEFPILVGYSAK